jgi:hypothetical protein
MRQIENITSLPVMNWTYNGKTYKYHLSLVDVEDFTRAVWREGEPRLAVAHTLLQRFAFLYSTKKPYDTFSSFLRAYVQPINPRWFPDGDLHKKELLRLDKLGKKQDIQEERARANRRLEYLSTSISNISLEHRDLVSRILSGLTKSPVPQAHHFSESKAAKTDTEEIAKTKGEKWGERKNLKLVYVDDGYLPGVNWFFSIPNIAPPNPSFSAQDMRSYALLVLLGLALLARKK